MRRSILALRLLLALLGVAAAPSAHATGWQLRVAAPVVPFRPVIGGFGTPGTAAEVAAGNADFVVGRTSANPLRTAYGIGTSGSGASLKVNDQSLLGFSTTQLKPATAKAAFGPLTLTVAYGGVMDANDSIRVESASDPTQFVDGTVNSFDPIGRTVTIMPVTYGGTNLVSDWKLSRHLPPGWTMGYNAVTSNWNAVGGGVSDWDFTPLKNTRFIFQPASGNSFSAFDWKNPYAVSQCLFDVAQDFQVSNADQANGSYGVLFNGNAPYVLTNDTVSFNWARNGSLSTTTAVGPGAAGSMTLALNALPADLQAALAKVGTSTITFIAGGTAQDYFGIRVIDVDHPSALQGTWISSFDATANTITLRDTNTVYTIGAANGPSDTSQVQPGDRIGFFRSPSTGILMGGSYVGVLNSDITTTNDFIQGFPYFPGPFVDGTLPAIKVQNDRVTLAGAMSFNHADNFQVSWADSAASIDISRNVFDHNPQPGINSGGNPRLAIISDVEKSWTAPVEYHHNVVLYGKTQMFSWKGVNYQAYVTAIGQGANGAARVTISDAFILALKSNGLPAALNGQVLLSGINGVPGLNGVFGIANPTLSGTNLSVDLVGSTYSGSWTAPPAVTLAQAAATGATSLTLSDTSQLTVGETPAGAGLQAGTKISAISGNTVTLNQGLSKALAANLSMSFAPLAVPAQVAPFMIHDVYFYRSPALAAAPSQLMESTGSLPPHLGMAMWNMYDATTQQPFATSFISTTINAGTHYSYNHVAVAALTATAVPNTPNVQLGVTSQEGLVPSGWQYSLDGGVTALSLDGSLIFAGPGRGQALSVQVRSTNAPNDLGMPVVFGDWSAPAMVTTSP